MWNRDLLRAAASFFVVLGVYLKANGEAFGEAFGDGKGLYGDRGEFGDACTESRILELADLCRGELTAAGD